VVCHELVDRAGYLSMGEDMLLRKEKGSTPPPSAALCKRVPIFHSYLASVEQIVL
jgi:hypothetical protein